MLKKFVSLILVTLLMLTLFSNAYAANTASVYSENFACDQGELISIPVYIKNNPGIMGFRISVNYPTEAFENPSVNKGEVTKNGSFDDSINKTTNGNFDVLWSSTGNVSSDGTMFIVELKVKDNAPTDKYNISLSYSQADTFNEKWQDVKLDCNEIDVIVGDYVEPELPSLSFIDSIIAFFRYLLELISGLFA